MRGLPFSLVCAHLQTETQGRKDQVVLNLDNMADSHWSETSTGGDLLKKERGTKLIHLDLHAWMNYC